MTDTVKPAPADDQEQDVAVQGEAVETEQEEAAPPKTPEELREEAIDNVLKNAIIKHPTFRAFARYNIQIMGFAQFQQLKKVPSIRKKAEAIVDAANKEDKQAAIAKLTKGLNIYMDTFKINCLQEPRVIQILLLQMSDLLPIYQMVNQMANSPQSNQKQIEKQIDEMVEVLHKKGTGLQKALLNIDDGKADWQTIVADEEVKKLVGELVHHKERFVEIMNKPVLLATARTTPITFGVGVRAVAAFAAAKAGLGLLASGAGIAFSGLLGYGVLIAAVVASSLIIDRGAKLVQNNFGKSIPPKIAQFLDKRLIPGDQLTLGNIVKITAAFAVAQAGLALLAATAGLAFSGLLGYGVLIAAVVASSVIIGKVAGLVQNKLNEKNPQHLQKQHLHNELKKRVELALA